MSEERKETDVYKMFKQLEEREKRANPYTFYDKDELIDEILKQEDKIEDLQQKVEQLEKERIEILYVLNNKMDYREFVDIVNKIEDILNKGSEENE